MAARIVIVGGGVGGLVVANRLALLAPDDGQITLVDATGWHTYQQGWLYVPFGEVMPKQLQKRLKSLVYQEKHDLRCPASVIGTQQLQKFPRIFLQHQNVHILRHAGDGVMGNRQPADQRVADAMLVQLLKKPSHLLPLHKPFPFERVAKFAQGDRRLQRVFARQEQLLPRGLWERHRHHRRNFGIRLPSSCRRCVTISSEREDE